MAAKKMTAKFRGTCNKCGDHIEVGEQILWNKSEGARHADCNIVSLPHPSQDEDGLCGARGYEYAQEVRGFNDDAPEPYDKY